jgi:peptidoglycan L-alanyl-D-glutamate endopeptidase CwlK
MPRLSQSSFERLDTCDTRIRRVIERAIKLVPAELDFTILCGHRNEKDQNKAYDEGNSKLRFPYSKHNTSPSLAIDIVPYPIDWKDLDRFYRLATYIFRAAQLEEVELEWGGHWTRFKDYPHWELK